MGSPSTIIDTSGALLFDAANTSATASAGGGGNASQMVSRAVDDLRAIQP
jgi:hypothetical protein